MIKLWRFIRFQLWVFYLVFTAFVKLFSPPMWHKSRLLSSRQNTWNLNKGYRGAGLISVFNSPKRNKISASTRLMYKFVEKIEIIKKSLLHIRSCILAVFRVTLIWAKCYISAVFFGSATFNKPNLFIFLFCDFYTLESYGVSIETWT